MRTNIRSVALLALLAAAGCSAVVDPAKNDPLKSAEGFCNSVQDVLDRLGCDVYFQGWGRADPTMADQLLTSLRSSCDNLKAAVDAGRYTYDGAAAQGCIDALEAGGCKGIFAGAMGSPPYGGPPFPAACTRVVKGNVAPGGACLVWNANQGATGFALNECSQGSTCRYGDYNVCQSTCGFDSDVGGTCGRGNYNCKSNLYCGADFTCHAYLAAGASCTGADQYHCDFSYTYCNGSTCQYLPYAGSVSVSVYPYCYPNAYPSGTPGVSNCVYKSYPGSGTCSGSIPCTSDSYCTSTGTCAYYSAEGGPCGGTGFYCGNSPVSLYCDSGNVCRRYPSTRLGQGADCYNLGSAYCADGLFCDTSNVLGAGANTCQPVQTSGICNGAWDMCAPGYECRWNGLNNECQQLGGLGAACDTNNGPMCLPGTWCKTATGTGPGTCSAYPGPGQACANAGMSACARGSYPVWGATCVCTAYAGEGSPCSTDSECGGQVNGMRCLANTCQPFACYTPLGWLGGSSGGPT